MQQESIRNTIKDLQFDNEIERLRARIDSWLETTNPEMRDAVQWQFSSNSKLFRPFTVFSCYRACKPATEPLPQTVIEAALVIEMFHNVSLIIDDILDKSEERRGKTTLHCHYGELPALMVSGYIVAEGYRIVRSDAFSIGCLSDLMERLGAAECMQWRLRRQPKDVEDWRKIAAEDTGSMFETCARLGTRDDRLRKFGCLLGMLYHGCDDVADVRGSEALGGGGDEDIRDGILTLPAALAIRDDDKVAQMFRHSDRHQAELAAAFQAKLAEAEAYLDSLAEEARHEAGLFAANPEPLLAIIGQTRRLSGTP